MNSFEDRVRSAQNRAVSRWKNSCVFFRRADGIETAMEAIKRDSTAVTDSYGPILDWLEVEWIVTTEEFNRLKTFSGAENPFFDGEMIVERFPDGIGADGTVYEYHLDRQTPFTPISGTNQGGYRFNTKKVSNQIVGDAPAQTVELVGDYTVARDSDGQGGNLTVEGVLTVSQAVGLSFETTITGDGFTMEFFVAHNLESLTLISEIYDDRGNQIDALVTCTSLNNAVVQFGVAPEDGETFRIVLLK